MDVIRIAILALCGLVGGFFVPTLARRQIAYKWKKKTDPLPADKLHMSLGVKAVTALVSMAGLALCGMTQAPWYVFLPVVPIWLIGMAAILVDVRVRIIANETVLALLGLGVVLRVMTAGPGGLLGSFLTMIGIMIVWILLGKIMGFGVVGAGDVKLCGAIGFMFGVPAVAAPMLVMALTMALYLAFGLVTRRLKLKSFFAMAPFLVTGMLLGLPYMLYTLYTVGQAA